MQKIRVLHIAKDDKFFDPTYSHFENDERLYNSAVLLVDSMQYTFKYIKNTESVKLLANKSAIMEEFSGPYDVIYFHSIRPELYSLIKYIPKDKIVIWWCWGYELYLTKMGMPPLISLPLYKSLTQNYIKSLKKSFTKEIKEIIKKTITGRFWVRQRNKFISRVDYFQPVLPVEYSLMKKNRNFRAKEFYPNRETTGLLYDEKIIIGKGNILLGNSASYENNHLDVWSKICDRVPSDVEVIVPLSYGIKTYADYLSKILGNSGKKLRILLSFMPKEEYFSLLDSCSFAVFGVIRQQSMGNIYYCLQRGMKVFMYRDSLVYKALVDTGFVLFAIEDINEESFRQPLNDEQIRKNLESLRKDLDYRCGVYERFWKDVSEELH